MKNFRHTNIEPAVDSLFEQLRLREPSSELDQKIAAMSRTVETHPVPMQRENRNLGWPAVVAIALVACLFGILLGSRIDAGTGGFSNSIDSQTRSNARAIIHGKQTLVSTEIEAGVEAFNWIHGHSTESANQDCANCHLFQEPAIESSFYDHEIFAQHPEYFPKCSRCHTGVIADWHEPKSNS